MKPITVTIATEMADLTIYGTRGDSPSQPLKRLQTTT